MMAFDNVLVDVDCGKTFVEDAEGIYHDLHSSL